MKQIKKILSVFAAFVLCLAPLSTMTVHAAGDPVTYYVKYVESSDQWRFQTGSWEDNGSSRELYYMHEQIKDGDIVVIDGGSATQKNITLDVNASLSNLTVVYSDAALVTAKSVDNFYGINDSISVVNAPVKNAWVYDYATAQINGNVDKLEVISEKEDVLHANVGVSGTVAHVKAFSKNYTHFEFYNFAKGSLAITDGDIKTAEASYSKTPVAATPTPAAPAAPAPSVSSGEYDDVPKTGDFRLNPLWLAALSAVCFAASCLLTVSGSANHRKEN